MFRKMLEEIKRMHRLMSKAGAWDSNDYSCGFFNGLEFCYAILQRREPYLRDRNNVYLERDLKVMRNLDMYDLGKVNEVELIDNLLDMYRKERVEQ